MNIKSLLKGTLIFGAGALVGSIITYRHTATKFAAILENEVENIQKELAEDLEKQMNDKIEEVVAKYQPEYLDDEKVSNESVYDSNRANNYVDIYDENGNEREDFSEEETEAIREKLQGQINDIMTKVGSDDVDVDAIYEREKQEAIYESRFEERSFIANGTQINYKVSDDRDLVEQERGEISPKFITEEEFINFSENYDSVTWTLYNNDVAVNTDSRQMVDSLDIDEFIGFDRYESIRKCGDTSNYWYVVNHKYKLVFELDYEDSNCYGVKPDGRVIARKD